MTGIHGDFEKHIDGTFAELSPRARSIVKRRYGLHGSLCMTLEAIGSKEGITRERVRQIEHDALLKIKKSKAFAVLATSEQYIADVIRRHGGIVAEHALIAMPEFAQVRDTHNLLFFLDVCSSITKRKEDIALYERWHVVDAPVEHIEQAVAHLARELKSLNTTLSEKDVCERLLANLKKTSSEVSHPALMAYLGFSKEIQKNKWDEYGHASSPFVAPRGMRDGAYVALTRARTPLHFRDIAHKISEFCDRTVHIQTVHNELIKDPRFVLVGRGLYALKEWGYEPGFVKDVLVKVLKEQGPLHKEQIVDAVLKHRQVKNGTILINLQNKKLFKSLEDGTYTTIVS